MENMIETEMESLKTIVDKVFLVDIKDGSRRRPIVEGRMIFTKILMDRGHGLVSVSRFIGKNHATLVHYNKIVEDLLLQSSKLFEKYMECKSSFYEKRDPMLEFVEKNAKKKVDAMREMLEEVVMQRDNAYATLERYSRVQEIIDLVLNRTPVGKEDFIYKKLNMVFNGI